MTEDQKACLLASNPFKPDLFDPEVLKNVITESDGPIASNHSQAISNVRLKNANLLLGQRAKDQSAPGVPGPSGVSTSSAASASEQPKAGSPLFDPQSKGGVQWPRGNRGRGCGGHRGKGGSRFSKTLLGFRK